MDYRAVTMTLLAGSLLTMAGCALEPPRSSPPPPASTRQSSPPLPPVSSTQASAQRAVTVAQQMLGKPYRYGGATPQGFDCGGLVYYSYSKAGYPIGRDSKSQIAQTTRIDQRELRPGDLVFFDIEGNNSHIGIYTGNRQFIHAPSSGKHVGYASMDDAYWRSHFVRAGRLR